ncbi:MAG TPA: aspartate aminotransferase family protein [Thermoplasmata archaeon]|nr:aspartate aminotransferase family protein [Thermoplasmata archaeon]
MSSTRSREGDPGPDEPILGPSGASRLTAEGSAIPSPSPPSGPAGGGEAEEKKKETPKESPKETAKETPKEAAKEAAKEAPKEAVKEAAPEPEPLPVPIARLVPKLKKSAKLFEEAKKYLPNGSSSLIRTASYDPCPPFIAKGKGSRIWDEDGNEYLDFNLAYGVLINGHAPDAQVKAIQEQVELGLTFGAPSDLEVEAAKMFKKMVPNAERVAFCTSGSDATMNAIRIARAATGKDAILKFEGHYHGQHDIVLISAEAPPMVAGIDEYPRPLPNSAGIPPGVTDYVLVAPYNSIDAFERIVRRYRNRLSCVILEPIMANSGVIPPAPDYLKRIVEIAHQNDMLVIFDEVFTGFRVAMGGAQQLYGVEPDISCWAKALGGGVPVSAVSGKAEYMELIAPGRISFGGTYNANNLTMAGALANLRSLHRGGEDLYARFGRLTEKLHKGLEDAGRDAKMPTLVQSVNGMLQFFFTRRKKISNYRESLQIDWNLYLRHHQLLLDKGIYIHPDNYERITLSSAHTEKDIEKFVSVAAETFAELRTLPRDYLP